MKQMCTRSVHALTRSGCLALLLATLTQAGGCYSKVVDAKGIGADSTRLRHNHEFGTDEPFGIRVRKDPPRR